MDKLRHTYGREAGNTPRLQVRTGMALGLLSASGLLANLTGCGSSDREGIFVDCVKYPDGNVSTDVDLQDQRSFVMGDGESEKISTARTLITIDVFIDQDGEGQAFVNAHNYLYEDLSEDPEAPTEVFRNSDNGHTITAVALSTDDPLESAPVTFTYNCASRG